MTTNAKRRTLFLAMLSLPLVAGANPVMIDGTSLIASCVVGFWAFIVEAGLVALLLTFSGVETLRVFIAYWFTNAMVFFLFFHPVLDMRDLPIPLLAVEVMVVILDAGAIKFLLRFSHFHGDGFSGVSWERAVSISAVGNAASYFVGYLCSKQPWLDHGDRLL
jgi:hypothetical protein